MYMYIYLSMYIYIYRSGVSDLPRSHWGISNNREGTSSVCKYMYIFIYIHIYPNM